MSLRLVNVNRILIAAGLAGPVALAMCLLAGPAACQTPAQSTSKPRAEPAPQSTPIPIEASAITTALGKVETARWTATTLEAATSEAHKKVLAGGKVMTVTGEVVDVSCYLQLGKRGSAHVACGSKCIANGQPIGLVDGDDNLYVLFAEEHHPRRDGETDLKKVFIPLLAKTVSVTGMTTEMKGYRALFVQAAEIGGMVKKMGMKKAETK